MFNDVILLSDHDFVRKVGIAKIQFQGIVEKIKESESLEKLKNPKKNRGLKGKLSLEDKILITLDYLRDYDTFFNLGLQYHIRESYACKIFNRYEKKLLKILDLVNPKDLLQPITSTIVVDVTEQPIERPKKSRKTIIQGKKSATLLKFN